MNAITFSPETELVKETEKAICISVGCDTYKKGAGTVTTGTTMWIPKSLIKNNEIPFWFIEKYLQEKAIDIMHFRSAGISITSHLPKSWNSLKY